MEDVEKKKVDLHNRVMNLTYIAAKKIIEKLLPQTCFESYRIFRLYESDTDMIKTLIIYLDDVCRISISYLFICAIRVDKKKKTRCKNIAFPVSKDLELDIKRALTELGFLD